MAIVEVAGGGCGGASVQVEEVMVRLGRIRLSVAAHAPEADYTDSTTYELRFGSGGCGFAPPWLEELPPDWAPEGGVVTAEGDRLIAAWRTNDRTTAYLVRHLPAAVWGSQVPGVPRLTVGMIAAHIHNSRCRWIKSLGARHGVPVPRLVDLRRVQPSRLLRALSSSSRGMIALIRLGVAHGGRVPRATWQNFPTDLEHFLSYFAAHEAHHRGQLCLVVRQLGRRLPRRVANGMWQWTRLARGSATSSRGTRPGRRAPALGASRQAPRVGRHRVAGGGTPVTTRSAPSPG